MEWIQHTYIYQKVVRVCECANDDEMGAFVVSKPQNTNYEKYFNIHGNAHIYDERKQYDFIKFQKYTLNMLQR